MTERERITEDLYRLLSQDGYLHLKECISAHDINAAIRAINHELGEGIPKEDIEKMRINAKSFGSTKFLQSKAIQNLFYETCVIDLVEELYGKENFILPQTAVQVALRFPQDVGNDSIRYLPWHLDNVFRQGLRGFGLLVGIFLNDTPEPNSGNFTVFPGAHLVLQEHFRKVPYSNSLYRDRNGYIVLPTVDIGSQQQILARAGDVVICHYQLPHRAAPNISSNIRMAVFFRVYHKHLPFVHPIDCNLRDLALKNLWSIGWSGMKKIRRDDDDVIIDVDVPSFCDCSEKMASLDIDLTTANSALLTQWIQGSKCSDRFEFWNASVLCIASWIKRSGTILNIGCANGFFLACLCKQMQKKNMPLIPYGIECDSSFFQCKRLFPQLYEDGHFIQIDLNSLLASIHDEAPIFPPSFDIICWNVCGDGELREKLNKVSLTKLCELLVPEYIFITRFNENEKENEINSKILNDTLTEILPNYEKIQAEILEKRHCFVLHLH